MSFVRATRPTNATAPCRRGCRVALVALVLFGIAALAPPGRAHEGPPFPVLVDEECPPWTVDVWADPDVGLGTFWVQLHAEEDVALPSDTVVWVHAAPTSGMQEELRWPSEPEPYRSGLQYVAEVEFPTREFWSIRVVVESASAGVRHELPFHVEVTPPGYGPIDLLLYVWPFLAVGFLWWKALRRHKTHASSRLPSSAPSP